MERMRYCDITYSFGIVEDSMRLLLRLFQEGLPATTLRNLCNLFPCQAKPDGMEPVNLAADLRTMRSDEAIISSASRKDVPDLLVRNALEEQSTREEILFEAA